MTHLHTDSSGARGVMQRCGVGRVRRFSRRVSWSQGAVERGEVKLCAVPEAASHADVGTKRLLAAKLESLMKVLGLYDSVSGPLVGTTDLGRTFRKTNNPLAIYRLWACAILKVALQMWGF